MNFSKIWQRNRTEAPVAGASAVSDPDEDEVLLPVVVTVDGEPAADETGSASAADDQGAANPPEGGKTVKDGENAPPAANGQDNPILAAVTAEGIKTIAQFESFVTRAKDGDRFRAAADEMFQKAAIRFYGPTEGMERVAAYAQLSADEKVKIAGAYNADADKKYGIGKHEATGGSQRQTAPSEQSESVNAEHGGDPNASKTSWDKLTTAQQSHGTSMGYKTPEAREKYAVEALKALGKAGE